MTREGTTRINPSKQYKAIIKRAKPATTLAEKVAKAVPVLTEEQKPTLTNNTKKRVRRSPASIKAEIKMLRKKLAAEKAAEKKATAAALGFFMLTNFDAIPAEFKAWLETEVAKQKGTKDPKKIKQARIITSFIRDNGFQPSK